MLHTKFGIDEVYFHNGFTSELLEKLQRRSLSSLDGEDTIVAKHVTHDMILIFYKTPNQNLIYRFLKALDIDSKRKEYIESNILLNEDELFSAIKSKTFVLVTHRTLTKDVCNPSISHT